MRTSVLIVGLLVSGSASADTPSGDPMRFTLGVPVEFNLVGFGVGVHPELLYRPASPDGWFHLRFALGVVPGPELTNLPVTAGVRAVAVPRRIVRPYLGLGVQLQVFVPYGAPANPRLDMYLEVGLDVRVAPRWRVGLDLSPEIGLVPGFGLGAAVRLGVRYDFAMFRAPDKAKRQQKEKTLPPPVSQPSPPSAP